MIGLNCRVSTQVVSTDISTDTSTDISVEAPHKIHDPQDAAVYARITFDRSYHSYASVTRDFVIDITHI